MATRDRRSAVIASPDFNGIDFVEIMDAAQTTLRVHFINQVSLQGTLTGQPTINGGETITDVPVLQIDEAEDWGFDEEHITLTLRVSAPGDFSTYTLTMFSPRLDSYFSRIGFSFKAACPSDVDCEQPSPPCPPPDGDTPPINYLAKDFLSFRQALLDFSALRYPAWQERSEADFGMMFLEALSGLADDLSYTQDRVAAEATLLTATQRRSAIRHSRLVDYEPTPATGSTVTLRFDVADGVDQIPSGIAVFAPGPDGTPVPFETGAGLLARLFDPVSGAPLDTPPSVPASAVWNAGVIQPYWFDDSQRCLAVGATSMFVLGCGYRFQAGQQLVIETLAETTADPPVRQIVQLTSAVELCDPIFPRTVDGAGPPFLTCPTSPPQAMAPTAVTQITWQQADKLTADRDLTRTNLAGNLSPATQGLTVSDEAFVIGAQQPGDPRPGTVTRTGPRPLLPFGVSGDPPPIQLYTLRQAPLTWLPQLSLDPSGQPLPEIVLLQNNGEAASAQWNYYRNLIDAGAGPFDQIFTIDPVVYREIGRNSDQSQQADYDGDSGDTIRFGDSSFGLNPDDGTPFVVTYRINAGSAGNVAADAISQLDTNVLATGHYISVSNPLNAWGGEDAQTLQSIQRLAPQAFRAQQFRVVTLDDYRTTAASLPWVQRAGATSRWTGSWLTNFTTPDPRATEQPTIDERTGLVALLNRYRMAGTESYLGDPDYLSLDLEIDVCALPDAFAGDVKQRLLIALSPAGPVGGQGGFFAPDNFTFGQTLERSALESTIQSVPGVAGVMCIQFRVRGRSPGFTEMGDFVPVGIEQIIRCDNDPSAPERGSLSVTVDGGR